MTLQQLKYVTAVAETGTISGAAQARFLSQPSLTAAIHDLEQELNITIFSRTNRGVALTPAGDEFLGYVRQVLEQTDLIEERYTGSAPRRHRFSVSTQHYSFAVEAFVDLLQEHGGPEYDFCIRETKTYEIIEDVARLRSEVGVLYLNAFNTGFHYAFGVAIVALVFSLVVFLANKKKLPDPKVAAASRTTPSKAEIQQDAREIKQRLYALFAVFAIVIFFWFSFHQNGMSLSFFARDFVDSSAVAPEVWQAINPFFVIVLTPMIMAIFGFLARRGKEISTPRKIAIGMFIAGLAFLFLAVFSIMKGYPSADAFRGLPIAEQMAAKAHWWVLIVTYFFLTVAELFISPLGLSFVSKVAPKSMLGLCQGLWLAATALGNLLLWIGPLMYNAWPIWQCWSVFLIVCLVSMGVMLGMVKWLERVTK